MNIRDKTKLNMIREHLKKIKMYLNQINNQNNNFEILMKINININQIKYIIKNIDDCC